MKTYKQLKEEFDKKVEKLQKECKHKHTKIMDKWWAIGHYSGKVKLCLDCNKILDSEKQWKYKEPK